MPKTIAIVNQKGGVGKTTTAINLSVSLAMNDKKILLIDSDPQGNSCSGLGVEKGKIDKGIYELLMQENEAEEVIIENVIHKNLDLIAVNENLVGVQVELVNEMGREFRLKTALSKVHDDYDYILIDCPPSLGLLTVNALTASDSVLLPIQCEFFALEGVTQLLNTIQMVRKNLNTALTIEGVILTMFDTRTNISTQIVEEVTAYFKEKTYKTLIPRNVRLVEAPSHGLPVIDYDKNSIGAKSYMELAKEFLEKVEE